MHNISGFERLPVASLDGGTANLVGGGCLSVENLSADDDRRLAGLYDNQICLFFVYSAINKLNEFARFLSRLASVQNDAPD